MLFRSAGSKTSRLATDRSVIIVDVTLIMVIYKAVVATMILVITNWCCPRSVSLVSTPDQLLYWFIS